MRLSDLCTSRIPWRQVLLCGLWLGLTATARAEEIRIGGTGAALGTMQLLGQAYTKTHPDIKVTVMPSMGSGGGIKAVLRGAIQVGVSSRPLTPAETGAGAEAVEYGSTPFVFTVSATSKVSGITTQQLVDFYAGKVNQWPDGSTLRLVLRPIGDSDSEMIKSISPAMREAKSRAEQRKGMRFTVTDQDTADSIEAIPGAIGPSTLALILSERRTLKALTLDGVVPGIEELASHRYPLSKQMLIVTGPGSSPAARAFVSFVQSAAGRDILQRTGHWVK